MTSKKATTKAKCRFLRQAQDGLFDRAVRKLLELPFDSAQGQDDTIFWWVGFVLTVTATATAKAKCGGLSTARWTMRLSVASVEMTLFVGGLKENEICYPAASGERLQVA
jgi:hypothetical protein